MNIAEKKQLYEGIRRVLKIGGQFALHDVVQRTPGPILSPVPWARTQELLVAVRFAAPIVSLSPGPFNAAQRNPDSLCA
jgi:hypothetical protein